MGNAMKTTRLTSLLLVLYTHMGANKVLAFTPGQFNTGKVIDTVICRKDPTQSYAVFIPAKGGKEELPVIYFFDPHANGSLPLYKYRFLADTYGFILVGSNNSKNGNDWPLTDNIWRTLFDDTQSWLRI